MVMSMGRLYHGRIESVRVKVENKGSELKIRQNFQDADRTKLMKAYAAYSRAYSGM